MQTTTVSGCDPDDPLSREIEGLDQLLRGAFGDVALSDDCPEDWAAIELPVRYRPLTEIGRGGVGIVLSAEDRLLGRRVAVKVLRRRHQGSALLRAKFESEGVIGAQLDHPGILGVLDVGSTKDGRPFFTMRLVPGEDLATRLAQRPALAVHAGPWLPVFARICDAVAYAHARGVVHRDLKPGNVLLGEFGEVLVSDWGMAKVVARDTAPEHGAEAPAEGLVVVAEGVLSQTGSLWGTPAYMAPEQARGAVGAASPRADVFGLGAILCQLLSGAPPYSGTPEAVLLQARLGDLDDANRRLRLSGADAELVSLATRCLAPNPLDRPADAMAVAAEMHRHLASAQERARAAALTAAAAESRTLAERRSRRAQRVWFAVVVALLTAGAGVALSWQWHDAARRHRDTTAAELALGEAFERWREAAERGEPADWRVVVSAATAATKLADAGDVTPSLRQRAQRLAVEAATKLESSSRDAADRSADAALRERLRELDGRHWFDDDLRGKEAGFTALFAGLGVDPAVHDADTMAVTVRAHRLRDELAIALDRWSQVARHVDADAPRTATISAAGRLVDDDPLRQRLRVLRMNPDEAAARSLAGTLDLRTVAPHTIYLLVEALRAAGAQDFAHELLERSQLEHPRDFGLASMLSQECASRNDRAGEARFASVALALRPEAMHAGTRLASCLDAAGREAQAELLFTRIAERHAHEPSLWHNVGAVHLLHGRFEAAVAAFRRVEDAGAGSAVTANLLARALRRMRRFDEARTWFATAAQRNPELPDPWTSLGAMLCDDLRDHPGAVAAFDRALAIAPGATDAMGNRALALQAMGRVDAACEQWRALAAVAPKLALPRHMLATAAFRAGDRSMAVAWALQAVQAEPGHADAWYLLGTSLDDLGERHAAQGALRAALRADPDHAAAWHDLGWTLVDQDATLDEAIAAYRRSIALRPAIAMSHHNLAYALLRAGEFEQCRQAATEALRLDPGLGIARDLLDQLPKR